MTLKQSDFRFNKKTFEINDRGVAVQDKSIISATDYFVEFDNIGPEKIRTKSGQMWMLYLSLGAMAISLLVFISGETADIFVVLFYFAIGIGLLITFIISFKDVLSLKRTDSLNGIEFLFNKPTKVELEKFINEVYERRNQILNSKYGQITPHLTFEALYNNQLWLLNRHAISQEEFENRIIQMNELFKKTEKSIGFNFTKSEN